MGFFSSIFGTPQLSDESKYKALCDDGVRAMQIGELVYAEKCFKNALELKRELRTIGYLAEVYVRRQDYADALPLLREISNASEDSLEVDLILAHAAGQLESYQEELDTCKAILQKHPDEPRALYLSAEALHGLDNDLEAVVNLSKCLYRNENYADARLLRARVLFNMGQHIEALEDINQLLEKEDENETYLLLRADLLIALDKDKEATADLEKIQTINPFCDEATLKLGHIYEKESLWDKALQLYNEAIEMRPDFSAAYKARGGVKHHLHDEAGAAEDLKRSLELAPETVKDIEGEYTNVENEMSAKYKNLNPYGF